MVSFNHQWFENGLFNLYCEIVWFDFVQWKLGAYAYMQELWRRKQSDVLRFTQRVRCWEYRQLPSIVRVTHPTRPDKARRLGYKAKQVFFFLLDNSERLVDFILQIWNYSCEIYSYVDFWNLIFQNWGFIWILN